MSHHITRYERDGETYWAIWSTVVDEFIMWDATAEEVIEAEAQNAYEEQRKRTKRHVEQIRNGENPYIGSSTFMEEAKRELENGSYGEKE